MSERSKVQFTYMWDLAADMHQWKCQKHLFGLSNAMGSARAEHGDVV